MGTLSGNHDSIVNLDPGAGLPSVNRMSRTPKVLTLTFASTVS
jgi:hypothetical protein